MNESLKGDYGRKENVMPKNKSSFNNILEGKVSTYFQSRVGNPHTERVDFSYPRIFCCMELGAPNP